MKHRGLAFLMPQSNALKNNPGWPSFSKSPAHRLNQLSKPISIFGKWPKNRLPGQWHFITFRTGFAGGQMSEMAT